MILRDFSNLHDSTEYLLTYINKSPAKTSLKVPFNVPEISSEEGAHNWQRSAASQSSYRDQHQPAQIWSKEDNQRNSN